ncbi:hypothetical protein EVAR_869_1 [Eumeta japonica]|uniref:Uncharacterized protein n=1 Tax=Eumeta variegata TaxID=151549 RepID=A0A4C1SGG4_EUMVA|nr:hypothetical protein EVAR_869_1 [Eumeta japonica]
MSSSSFKSFTLALRRVEDLTRPRILWLTSGMQLACCARGRPIIVEWERDARHSAGLSLVRIASVLGRGVVAARAPPRNLRRRRRSAAGLFASTKHVAAFYVADVTSALAYHIRSLTTIGPKFLISDVGFLLYSNKMQAERNTSELQGNVCDGLTDRRRVALAQAAKVAAPAATSKRLIRNFRVEFEY